MAKVNKIEFGVLFDNEQTAQDYLDDFDSSDSTRRQVLDDIVTEYPLVVTVDGEVFQSVDHTSADKCKLVFTFISPKVSDDTFEDLADSEPTSVVKAAQAIVRDNDFEVTYDNVI